MAICPRRTGGPREGRGASRFLSLVSGFRAWFLPSVGLPEVNTGVKGSGSPVLGAGFSRAGPCDDCVEATSVRRKQWITKPGFALARRAFREVRMAAVRGSFIGGPLG